MIAHVSIKNVAKSFGGNLALNDVSIDIKRGTVHCLIGENGAGKSTLGKIIAGIHLSDAGEVLVEGHQVRFRSPKEALSHGITAMAQEVALVNSLTVEQNVLLGIESSRFGLISSRENKNRVKNLLKKYNFNISASKRVEDLNISDQQRVEIVKALARRAELIIMDEPTASLDRNESGILLETIRQLRDSGTTIVLVSHHLDEILAVADDITVLRNGNVVYSGAQEGHTEESLTQLMLGKALDSGYPQRVAPPSDPRPILSVRELSVTKKFSAVSFDVKPGEILGIAGLVGSGRTDVLRAIAAAEPFSSGEVFLAGKKVKFGTPRNAMESGIYMIPEDRKTQGLLLSRSVQENISLSTLKNYSTGGVINSRLEERFVSHAGKSVDIRAQSYQNPASSLSGGNQQKILFARASLINPRVLLVDEPTKGVDVGAKFGIHQLLVDAAARGVAVVVVSSEHDELIGISHRILVMQQGRLVGEFEGPDFEAEEVKRAIVVPSEVEMR